MASYFQLMDDTERAARECFPLSSPHEYSQQAWQESGQEEVSGNEKQADVLNTHGDQTGAQALSVFYRRSHFAAVVKMDLIFNDLPSASSTTRALKHL